jgi:hypothetical protein
MAISIQFLDDELDAILKQEELGFYEPRKVYNILIKFVDIVALPLVTPAVLANERINFCPSWQGFYQRSVGYFTYRDIAYDEQALKVQCWAAESFIRFYFKEKKRLRPLIVASILDSLKSSK